MNSAICFAAILVWVMFLLIIFAITAIHLAYPYAASDKFSYTEPDKDAESFLQLIEATTLWNGIKMNFVTGFSDGRNRFRQRLEVEHCWPDDTNGIPNAQQNAERTTQKRQQKQRYMDYNLRGFKPNYFQLKAQEQLMEYPNASWNDFSTQNIQEAVMLQVSSNFLHDVEQIKTELGTLRQEMRNLRVELQEHRVNAMKGNSRSWAPTQKGKQKPLRFCNYCHKNGHTPNWRRKKMRKAKIRRVQHHISLKKNTAPIQEYGTSDSNCRSQHDENVNRPPDSDEVKIPINKLLTAEEEPCLDEGNNLTTPDPESVLRTRTRQGYKL